MIRAVVDANILVSAFMSPYSYPREIARRRTKGSCVSGELALKGIAPDPGDDKIISCAIERDADFIVTGDKALQQLKEYRGIKIINAEQFIRVFRE